MFLSVINTSCGGLWETEDYQRSFFVGLEKNCHKLSHYSPSLRCGGLHSEIILGSELHIGVTLIATLLHFYRQA